MYYLYIKKHNVTGLKYLGYTSAKDPYKYKGSGKYWSLHIKKYGYDVTTIILLASDSKEEIKTTGEFFSDLFGVVKHNDWANLKIESCDGGWDYVNSNISEHRRTELAKACTILGLSNKNTVCAKNSEGKTLRVSVEEYSNDDTLTGHTKGFCFLYDKEGNKYRKETSTRIKNLNGNNFGKIYINNGTIQKMIPKEDILPEGWIVGKLSTTNKHNKGKIWITNGIDSKMVFKDESIPELWRKGRTF
jgi:hypothetical protein